MPVRPNPTRLWIGLAFRSAFLTLIAVAAAVAIAGPTGDPAVGVSTRDAVQFSLTLPAAIWHPAGPARDGQPGWAAGLAGFMDAGLPGEEKTPRRGGWLVLPPGTTPRLEAVQESWTPAPAHALALEPIPRLEGDPDSEDVFASEELPGPGKAIDVDTLPATVRADLEAAAKTAPASGAAVSLGEIGWWRGHRVVSYVIQPVQVDASGHATRVLTGGTWRVRFEPDPAVAKAALPDAAKRKLTTRGDDRFSYMFLNGGQLASWPTEAAARGAGARAGDVPSGLKALRGGAKGTPLGYPEVRLPVPRTQLYRVRASDMRSSGLLPSDPIQESQVRLYQRRYVADLDDPASDTAAPYVEVEVPILMVGDGGAFENDDYFLFWGLRLRDDGAFNYTVGGTTYPLADCGDPLEASNNFNVYWLQLADPDAGGSWARMATTSLPPSGGNPLASYRRTDHLQEAQAYREFVPSITTVRGYYNTNVADLVDVTMNLWSPIAGQTGATLTSGVATYATSDRVLDFMLRGASTDYALPSYTATSNYVTPVTMAIPPAALSETSLKLRITRNPSGSLSAYLAYVELAYDAAYVAPGGRLLFDGGEPAAVNDVEVTGFATDAITLLDVTEPRQPAEISLTRSNLVADGSQTRLSIQIDQTSGRRKYYAVTGTDAGGVADISYSTAVAVTDPVIPTQLAESTAGLVVVVHPKFREAAQRWIDHREERAGVEGLTIQVVAPQDVYDWYSGGLKNAWAIKRLANHALESPRWLTYAMMLIGDANENARELGVTAAGRPYATDYVPTHHHVQDAGVLYKPEVLASDKWYAYPNATDANFPSGVTTPFELYVGRFPCDSVTQLNTMIDKTFQAEANVAGETWKKRALFFADDCFSLGNYGDSGFRESYQPNELQFEISERDSLANYWRNNGGMVPLVADTLMLRAFMQDLYPVPWDNGDYLWSAGIRHCEQSAVVPLKTSLSAGGLIAHYQGHGNMFLMAHENWFKDDRRGDASRTDVGDLTNFGKPWMYFGMGCHLADFAQAVDEEVSDTPIQGSLCEKFLGFTAAGAYAAYGSSGYEYLGPNEEFSEWTLNRWMIRPPTVSVHGEPAASRWVLGELMWASEADALASVNSFTYRAMVSQYTLLGDPLMVLDCGAPYVEATLGGEHLELETELVATDASNTRTVTLEARDEAGIAGVQVLDSTGADLTGSVVQQTSPDVPNRQIVQYELTLPVRPFEHDIFVHVRDTADRLPTDDHVIYTFHVPQTAEFMSVASGDVIDPATFIFAPLTPVAINATLTTAANLTDQSQISVTGDGLVLSDVQVQIAKSTDVNLSFTADAIAGHAPPRSVVVTIDGYATSYVLEAGEGTGGEVTIGELINYPNPMRDTTSILFRTNLGGGQGRLLVYTVAGRQIVDLAFPVGAGAEVVVPWDGRDSEGDRLANGVYLYRVQVDGAAGNARSDMQRLVVMR